MNQNGQNQLLQTLRWHYARETSRKKRSPLIDAFCRATGKERKYAIKLLRRKRGPESRPGPPKARPGRQAVYGPREIVVLKALWFLSEQPCGKRLKAVLPL